MFTLVHQYKYTLTELESMVPWERDLYVGMLNNWVKEETEKVKKMKSEQEARINSLIAKKKQINRRR
jgi:hypothetical protein